MKKSWKMTETLVHGYSNENTMGANECQYDRVWMVIKTPCILVLSIRRVKDAAPVLFTNRSISAEINYLPVENMVVSFKHIIYGTSTIRYRCT